MDEIRIQLEESVRGLEPRWRHPEEVRRCARRRRTNARVGAALVAGAITIGVFAWALPQFGGSSPPTGPSGAIPRGELDVRFLMPAWTAEVPSATTLPGVPTDQQHVYLVDAGELLAFPKDCEGTCSPAWRAPLEGGSSIIRVGLVVAGDVVVASTETSLAAFASDCGSGGSTCSPLWRAVLPQGATEFAGPVTVPGYVRVMYGLGGNENSRGVQASIFALGCRSDGGVCQPQAIVDLGSGPISVPGAGVDGVFYQRVGGTLSGIDPRLCGEDEQCRPVVDIQARDVGIETGAIYDPVVAAGELIMASADGRLSSYRPGCGAECQPQWYGEVSRFLEQPPVLAGETVVVSGGEELVAFSVGCGSAGALCEPLWHASLGGSGTIEYGDARSVVAVERDGVSNVVVFPASCSDPCEPLWSVRTPSEAQGVVVGQGHVFVGMSGGTVSAYPLECRDPCRPAWSADAGDGDVWDLSIDDAGVYVAVSANGSFPPGGDVRLRGFREAT
ncbi:MAG: PQQ-binding-like beta-propeller repeat protein [Actinomycetota bacterium]